MTSNTLHQYPNGGGLLGVPIQASEWTVVDTLETVVPSTPAAAARTCRSSNALRRLASLSATGSFATLSYAVIKFAYYWPVLQASINTQFSCF